MPGWQLGGGDLLSSLQLACFHKVDSLDAEGKVAVKVGLKWPSIAGLLLQDLAHLALWV